MKQATVDDFWVYCPEDECPNCKHREILVKHGTKRCLFCDWTYGKPSENFNDYNQKKFREVLIKVSKIFFKKNAKK